MTALDSPLPSPLPPLPSSLDKLGDFSEILKDAEYFSDELQKRLERLAALERSGKLVSTWQQAAGVTRRVRGVCRSRKDILRREANLEANREASREAKEGK